MPFLNSLRTLPEYYKRFTIDKYLKRYKDAVHNIVHFLNEDSSAGEEYYDILYKFSSEHNLHALSIKLLQKTETSRLLDLVCF